MVGYGLRKLAAAHDMRIDKGVAYGSLFGYAATLSEGMGYKSIDFSVAFADPQQQFALQTMLNDRNLYKEFRVQKLTLAEKSIQVLFHDNPGTMKKVQSFLEWFIPQLDHYGASKADICAECGNPVVQGQWKLIDGIAYYFHEECAAAVKNALEEDEENRKREDTGTYYGGCVGAFLGAALGSVVWAVVYYLGYFMAIVGLLIGWLADKGYSIFKGKNGKGKIVILALAVIFGVVLGIVMGDILELAAMIYNGELYDCTYGDIPWLLTLLLEDAEYVSATMKDMLVGIILAGIGVFALLRRNSQDVSGVGYVDLK